MSLALAVGLPKQKEEEGKQEESPVLFSLRITSWDFALAGHSQSESISDLLKIHYRSFHIQMADDRQTYGHLDLSPLEQLDKIQHQDTKCNVFSQNENNHKRVLVTVSKFSSNFPSNKFTEPALRFL